ATTVPSGSSGRSWPVARTTTTGPFAARATIPTVRRSRVDPCHSRAALGVPIRDDRPPASTTPAEIATLDGRHLVVHIQYVRLVIVIVAGVSGSGKTTVGALLAGRLGWRFADADDFHPAANVAKMRAGIPLTDTDRWPWLRAIATWIDECIGQGEDAVLACSALKRSYRDELLDGRPAARMVFLAPDREVLARRL